MKNSDLSLEFKKEDIKSIFNEIRKRTFDDSTLLPLNFSFPKNFKFHTPYENPLRFGFTAEDFMV